MNNTLSWHAVIPLYRYGVDPDYIRKIVLIPEYLEIDEKKGQVAFMAEFTGDTDISELTLLPADFTNNSDKIDYIDSVA